MSTGPRILSYIREEAIFLGNSEKATILEFIRWSIGFKAKQKKDYNQENSKYFFNEHWWCQESYYEFRGLMPWLGEATIKRYVKELCDLGVLIKKRKSEFGGGNCANFYRVDEKALSIKMDPASLEINLIPPGYQDDPSLSIKMIPTPLYTQNPTLIHLDIASHLSPELRDFARTWYDFALREMKWTKPPESWSISGFAVELDNVMRLEGINLEGMREVLRFIEGGFWAGVITTPRGLLKLNEEKQRRITVILRQMKPKSVRSQEKHEAMSEEEKQRIDNETAQLFGFGGKR